MTENIMLPFLTELRDNNTLDWMHAHKDRYQQALQQFTEVLERLIALLGEDEPALLLLDAKRLISRLNRDTRFSHDKSPYTAAFRGHISTAGKLPIPGGYYLHLAPGGSFLGGGVPAAPFADAVSMVRDYICAHGSEWDEITGAPAFQSHFTMVGEKLKNVPRGYDPAFPQAEALKYKSWIIECPIADEALADPEAFCRSAAKIFRLMRPFNAYLNTALRDFQMPQRPKK